MKRSPLLLLLLPLALSNIAIAQAPKADLTKPISYRTVAVPVRQALKDLSKAMGTSLIADGDLGEERIILRLDGVPAQTVLDNIASACSAEWRPVKGGLELFRSPALVAKLQQEEMDRRVKRVTDSIRKMAADAATDGRMTAEKASHIAQLLIHDDDLLGTGNRPPYNAQATLATIRPMAETRFIARILSSMDPREIASLTPGGRFVYTGKPNAVQRQLPPIDDSLVQAYVEDQNLIADSVVGQVAKVKGQVPPEVSSEYAHIKDSNFRIFVIFEPSASGESIRANLNILDSASNTVGEDMVELGKKLSVQDYRSQVDQSRVTANEKGLTVDPELKLLLQRFTDTKKSGTATPLDPALRSALLTPTEHDPLSFFTSNLVLEAADNENLNTVFVPTDLCESAAISACRNGKFTRPLLTTLLTQSANMDCTIEDGWFIGNPVEPLQADVFRCPRTDLETYLQSIEADGYVSIENQVALVLASTYGTAALLPSLLKTEIWGSAASLDNYPDENTIRLYGSLTEDEKSAAKKGLTLTVASLTPENQKALTWFVYTGYSGFSVSPETWNKFKNGNWRAIYAEKTELTPNGLSPSDTLTITEKTDPVIYYAETQHGQFTFRTSGSVEEAAQRIATAEVMQDPVYGIEVDHFSVGSRRQITLKLAVQGLYEMEGTIDENRGGDLRGVSPDKLASTMSPDVRDQFVAALAKYRARFKQYKQAASPAPAPQPSPPLLFLDHPNPPDQRTGFGTFRDSIRTGLIL